MKHTEKTKFNSVLKQSIAGSITGILFLLVSAAILATLVLNSSIPEERIKLFVLVLIVFSTFLGTLVGRKSAGENKNVVCFVIGMVIFCTLLLMTAVLFGGKYTGVGETGLLILCGCVLPIFVKPGGKKKKKPRSQMVKLYKKL